MALTLAVVAGASGLTGRQLMTTLGEDPFYDDVRALSRADNLATLHARQIPGATHLFCCLGATIAKAGSQPAFREVDFDYVVRFARAGLEAGATHLSVVSSVGANPAASNFYLRVKGEAEAALRQCGFPSLDIFRPSLLIGERAESRPGESFAALLAPAISWMLVGSLSRYRPMPVSTLARAMAAAGRLSRPGHRVLHHDEITALAATPPLS
jgi:uncharacterized protein YbjT (DUF2867 family)